MLLPLPGVVSCLLADRLRARAMPARGRVRARMNIKGHLCSESSTCGWAAMLTDTAMRAPPLQRSLWWTPRRYVDAPLGGARHRRCSHERVCAGVKRAREGRSAIERRDKTRRVRDESEASRSHVCGDNSSSVRNQTEADRSRMCGQWPRQLGRRARASRATEPRVQPASTEGPNADDSTCSTV